MSTENLNYSFPLYPVTAGNVSVLLMKVRYAVVTSFSVMYRIIAFPPNTSRYGTWKRLLLSLVS